MVRATHAIVIDRPTLCKVARGHVDGEGNVDQAGANLAKLAVVIDRPTFAAGCSVADGHIEGEGNIDQAGVTLAIAANIIDRPTLGIAAGGRIVEEGNID